MSSFSGAESRADTIIGTGGAVYDVTVPTTVLFGFDVEFAIDSALAAGSLSPANDGAMGLPTPASGTTGYGIDSVDGAVIDLPDSYTALLVVASGVTTVIGSPTTPQLTLVDTGPSTFILTGGTGTVSSGNGFSLFETPTVGGGTYLYEGVGGADTIAANSGTQQIGLVYGFNLVFLGSGADTFVSGNGHDTIRTDIGSHVIYEGRYGSIFLGSGTDSVTAIRRRSGGRRRPDAVARGRHPRHLCRHRRAEPVRVQLTPDPVRQIAASRGDASGSFTAMRSAASGVQSFQWLDALARRVHSTSP